MSRASGNVQSREGVTPSASNERCCLRCHVTTNLRR